MIKRQDGAGTMAVSMIQVDGEPGRLYRFEQNMAEDKGHEALQA